MTRPTDVVAEIEGSGAASVEDRMLLIQQLGRSDSVDVSRGHGPSGSASDPLEARTWTIDELLGSWSGPRPLGGET